MQATLTLNILRNYCFNPKFSSHASLYGILHYNKTPLAPLGTRVLFQYSTTNHRTWETRVTYGWYISPDLEYNRCVELYTLSTHSTIIAGTVEFISTVIPIYNKNSEDCLRQQITYIISILV